VRIWRDLLCSFFDSANNCYSPTTLVTATSASCASGVIDCSKTQLYPAPVVGVSGQKVLYVTVNVSTGCFSPLSVSGSGFSVANGVTQVCTPQQESTNEYSSVLQW
jgi:methyl coenzyme M reductase beta subunit